MIDKIKEYISEAQGFSSQDPAELEAFRIKFLGSKGLLKELFAEFKNVPNEQKKEFGQVINLLKTSVLIKLRPAPLSKRPWNFSLPTRIESRGILFFLVSIT